MTFPAAPDELIDDFVAALSVSGDPLQTIDSDSVMNNPAGDSYSSLREIQVEFLSGVGRASVAVNETGVDSRLIYSTSAGVTGDVLIGWDFDGYVPPGGSGPSGGAVDLTENGERTGLMLHVGVDQAGLGEQLMVRLIGTDPSELSVASATVPVTNGFDTAFVYIPFSDFAGTADPSSVLSVELQMGAGSPSVDASIDTFAVIGPKALDFSVVTNSVPEPTTFGLASVAAIGMLLVYRRRNESP